MTIKYNLDEIRENLDDLKEKLKDKGREKGFWVIASRKDFKPIVLEETVKDKTVKKTVVSINEIKNDVLEDKEQYFRNKKLAYINIWILPYIFKDTEKYSDENINKIKDNIICGITVDIYEVNDDGEIDKKSSDHWRCTVNFTVDDLTKHKLKFTDAEVIMRQVAEKLVRTVSFGGIDFKDYVKVLKKNIKNLK